MFYLESMIPNSDWNWSHSVITYTVVDVTLRITFKLQPSNILHFYHVINFIFSILHFFFIFLSI